MSQSQEQPEYQHRVLPPHISTFWWLESGSYFAFIVRELSCVFVAWFVVYLLLLVSAVSQGAPAYQQLLAWSATPFILFVNIVSLLSIAYHAVTFFAAAPQAIVVKVGPNTVPGSLVLAGHYAGLAGVSAVVCWLLLGA